MTKFLMTLEMGPNLQKIRGQPGSDLDIFSPNPKSIFYFTGKKLAKISFFEDNFPYPEKAGSTQAFKILPA